MPEPVSILDSHASRPDASGLVTFEPYSNFDTGATIDPIICRFQDQSLKVGVNCQFKVPGDYLSTPLLRILWNAIPTTGNAIWDWSVLPRAVGEDMGAAPVRTSETVTTAVNGTTFFLNESVIALTDADYSPGDTVLAILFRDALNASDTLNADTFVFDALFDYS